MTANPAARFDRRAWTRLLVLCTAVLFEGMSMSSINVQLPSIQRELRLSPDALQLVASSFLAAYAGLLLLGGKCADRWGHRPMFLAGVAIFSAGSLAAALSRSAALLIAARGVQGAGAAATAPAALALVISGFPEGAPRNKALGVFSAMGAVGFSLGVVSSGLLTQETGWRAAFLMYVPLGLLVLGIGARTLGPSSQSGTHRGPVPWLSGALVTGGLTGVVWAGGLVGTGSAAEVTAAGSIGLAAIALFAVLQARHRAPLLPLSLLADRRMAAAGLALGGAFAGVMGAMLLVATDLQSRDGYSALATGLAFLPQGLAVGLLSAPAARLVNRGPAHQLLLRG